MYTHTHKHTHTYTQNSDSLAGYVHEMNSRMNNIGNNFFDHVMCCYCVANVLLMCF